ncbi:MAG: lipid A deacylase LpxR family protein [Arachidicoccus sp.]|nr:lipid A deacylase LpxR family protein [Arachidicoccus sp.]
MNNFLSTIYKTILLYCICFAVFHVSAQTQHYSELQITSDNDSYTLRGKDGYYTNGLNIAFRWRNKRNPSSSTIRSVSIGQLMYNAKNGSYSELYELDRPVTAFLYGAYTQTNFTKKENVLQWNIMLGTIGPPAFGRQMQEAIHSTLGMYKPREWDFQLKTEVGVNGSFKWSPQLKKIGSAADIKPIISATVGNTFTNTNLGAALLLGKFNSNSSSVFWNANLNSNQKESFFYAYPQIIFKAYDATVQGGLFINDKGPYVGRLNRAVFRPQIGWMYSNGGFLLNLALFYESKESLTQIESQFYGRISLGFLF